MANLSKTLHISFYQNRSSIVEFMIKNFGVFLYASQCVCFLRLMKLLLLMLSCGLTVAAGLSCVLDPV